MSAAIKLGKSARKGKLLDWNLDTVESLKDRLSSGGEGFLSSMKSYMEEAIAEANDPARHQVRLQKAKDFVLKEMNKLKAGKRKGSGGEEEHRDAGPGFSEAQKSELAAREEEIKAQSDKDKAARLSRHRRLEATLKEEKLKRAKIEHEHREQKKIITALQDELEKRAHDLQVRSAQFKAEQDMGIVAPRKDKKAKKRVQTVDEVMKERELRLKKENEKEKGIICTEEEDEEEQAAMDTPESGIPRNPSNESRTSRDATKRYVERRGSVQSDLSCEHDEEQQLEALRDEVRVLQKENRDMSISLDETRSKLGPLEAARDSRASKMPKGEVLILIIIYKSFKKHNLKSELNPNPR